MDEISARLRKNGPRELEKLTDEELKVSAPNGRNIMHNACIGGNLWAVKFLCSRGFDTEQKTKNGTTPLHFAARFGKTSIVKFLVIEKKVEIDVEDKNKNTPLHEACFKNTKNINYGKDLFDIVKFLSNEGDGKTLPKNKNGDTPLHCAIRRDKIDIVNFFINECCVNIEIKGQKQQTPLHVACKEGRIEIVKLLLSRGADIGARDERGMTPLHLACDRRIYKPPVKVQVGGRELTIGSWKCPLGRLPIVEYLVMTGNADVNAKNKMNRIPLCLISKQPIGEEGQREVMKFLMMKDSDYILTLGGLYYGNCEERKSLIEELIIEISDETVKGISIHSLE